MLLVEGGGYWKCDRLFMQRLLFAFLIMRRRDKGGGKHDQMAKNEVHKDQNNLGSNWVANTDPPPPWHNCGQFCISFPDVRVSLIRRANNELFSGI